MSPSEALDATRRLTKNEGAVRKVVAISLSLVVQAAALAAPLVHAHPDDHATAHHAGRSMHTHWTGHAHVHHHGDTPAFSPVDHDAAVFVNVFVAVANPHVAVPMIAHAVFMPPVQAERVAQRGLEVVRSHDPPYVRSLSSRGPPAFLS